MPEKLTIPSSKTCPRCGVTGAKMSGGYCLPCRREYNREWYAMNGERKRASSREYHLANRNKVLQRNKRTSRELKVETINAYGGQCACCGERLVEFLAIDHIDGNGISHRTQANGSGKAFYRWLKKQGFPQEGLRVLCHNCNQSLGNYGYCPHQTAERDF